jgi:hypothetical protein
MDDRMCLEGVMVNESRPIFNMHRKKVIRVQVTPFTPESSRNAY